MPEPSPAKTRVLFVDDDSGFLEMVNRVFGELSQGAWDIYLAADAENALRQLKRQPVDLAVLDVCMPGVDGLQLLRTLAQEFPALPKVLLTGGADHQTRVDGLEGGAQLFLEKPTTAPGFLTVFATLNELAKWHLKQGARDVLPRAGLLDLVKLECVSGNSRLFEVVAGETRGLIYVKEGNIVHAETEGRRGQSAFTFLATLPAAEFSLRQFVEAPERSIYRQWEFLFLEAVQLQEQLNQAEARTRDTRETQEPGPSRSKTPAPTAPRSGQTAFVDRSEPSAVAAVAKMAAPASTGGTGLFARTPAPPPTPPKPLPPEVGHLKMVRTAPGADRPKSAAPPLELPPLKPAPARLWPEDGWEPDGSKIGELLVCSVKQEVLHEWQCPEADERLRFVTRLREKSASLAESLPLGPCDRVELREPGARLVVLFQPEATVLVRSNTPAWPLAKDLPPANQPALAWLEQYVGTRGLLGSGILHPSGRVVVPATPAESSWQNLIALWRSAIEVFDGSNPQPGQARQLRWVFERAQLYGSRRLDDLALVLLVTRNPQILDAPVLEQMFAEFETLHAA